MAIEGNTGSGKITILQKFEQSLYCECKVTIKIEHEPVKEFQCFYGNDLINPLEHFYKNPTDSVFIFLNYVLDVYQQRMETLETVQHPCMVVVMDHGLDTCQIFTTVDWDQYTKFGFLYLTYQRYNKYLNSVCSEGNYCTSVTGENENVHT